MSDSVEETVDLEVFLGAGFGVFDPKRVEEVAVTFAFDRDSVPEDSLESGRRYKRLVGRNESIEDVRLWGARGDAWP